MHPSPDLAWHWNYCEKNKLIVFSKFQSRRVSACSHKLSQIKVLILVETSLSQTCCNAGRPQSTLPPFLHPRVRPPLKASVAYWDRTLWIWMHTNHIVHAGEAVVSLAEHSANRRGRPGFQSQTAVNSRLLISSPNETCLLPFTRWRPFWFEASQPHVR